MAKIIGRVGIKVVPEVDNKRPEMRRDVDRMLDDMERDARKRRPVKLPVELDKEHLSTELDRALRREERKGHKLTLKVSYDLEDGMRDARRRIESKLNGTIDAELGLEISDKDITEGKHKIDQFVREAKRKDIDIPVNVTGTALTAARLSYLTRPRVAPIFAKVNGKSVAIAEGILRSLAGLNVLQRIGTSLEDVIKNFDKFAVKGASVATVVGAVTDSLSYMVTSLFSIGEGILNAVGLLAMAPALLSGLTASVVIAIMGFTDFRKAVKGDADALAALTPKARDAANALRGTWTAIQQPVQKAFWDGLGTSLQDSVMAVLPVIRKGLSETAVHLGRFTKGFLDSFKEIAKNGDMTTMFRNLARGFDEGAGAAKPLADAINTLGLRGSEYLPDMGRWVKGLARDFNKWVKDADKAGDINRWIEQGVQSFKDMGSVIHGVSRQFKGLTTIILDAGGSNLSTFAIEMERWGDIMNGEPFRSRMVTIFKGARSGASRLNDGFKDLADQAGKASDFVGALLSKLGDLGGGALSRIGDIFGERGFQTGVLQGVSEIDSAIRNLGPTAQSVGRLIGTVFDTGGTVIQNLVPLIENVTRILDNMLRIAGPGLEALSGPLSRLLNNGLLLLEAPLMGVANAIRYLGDVIPGMPRNLQALVAAFAAFILLRGRLAGTLTAFSSGFGKLAKGLQGKQLEYAIQGSVIRPLEVLPTKINDLSTRTKRASNRLGGAVRGVGSKLQAAAKSISGFMGLGGGLVGGLAIMGIFTAIATGIGIAGEKAAQNKERIDGFADSLTELGETTQDTTKLIADSMGEPLEGYAFEKSKESAQDLFRAIGVGASDAARAVAGSQPAYDSFIDKLNTMRKELLKQQTGNIFSKEEAARGRRITAIQQSIEWAERERDALVQAQKKIQAAAEASGTSTESVASLRGAMDTLGDSMATAAEKGDALNTVLDVLSGGAQSQQEAAIAFADSLRGIKSAIKAAKEGKIKVSDLIDSSGKIDVSLEADPTGLKAKIAKAMTDSASDGLSKAFAAAKAAPPKQQAKVFADTYQQALESMRAVIVPALGGGKKAQAQFDAWVKNNKLDKVTIEAILDGTIDEAELAKLPPEIRDFIENALGVDPVKAPVDADDTSLRDTVAGANVLLKQLGATRAIPKIDADGKPLDAATQKAVGLLKKIGGATTVAEIDATAEKLNAKQKAALRKLLQIDSYEAIPTIDANGKPLSNEVRASIAKLLGLGRQKPTPKLDANPKPFDAKIDAAQREGRYFNGKVYRTKLDADNARAAAKINQSKGQAQDFARRDYIADVIARTHGYGSVRALAAAISAVRSKSVTVSVGTIYNKPKGYVVRSGRAVTDADGSITYGENRYHKRFQPKVTNYLNGGFSSKPTAAHIARAGSYVTYAEKETGGEAFIPLAASKRGRSTAILNEVAKMFGLQLVNAQMADGGVNGSTTPVESAMVSIGQMIVADPDEATRKIRNSQRDALAMQNMEGLVL